MGRLNTIACVVVLYNPGTSLLKNISTYIKFVDRIYIIDNSDRKNEVYFPGFSSHRINYIFNGGNSGIAAALNIACRMAIEEGYKYILTMDQDSYFEHLTDSIVNIISRQELDVAIYYPQYKVNGEVYEKGYFINNKMVGVMTSGNILSLEAYELVGGFEEKLFIDYVDIEMCLKLFCKGYVVKMIPEMVLNHNLGNTRYKSLFGKKIVITNHSYIRRYYITRNRLYVSEKYKRTIPEFSKADRKVFANDILKILFIESEKIKKIKSILIGYWHYKVNRFGKLNSRFLR